MTHCGCFSDCVQVCLKHKSKKLLISPVCTRNCELQKQFSLLICCNEKLFNVIVNKVCSSRPGGNILFISPSWRFPHPIATHKYAINAVNCTANWAVRSLNLVHRAGVSCSGTLEQRGCLPTWMLNPECWCWRVASLKPPRCQPEWGVCVLFLYKDACVWVCVCQECFPLWSQFACHLWSVCISAATLPISRYSSDHLMNSHTLCICQEAIQMRPTRSIFTLSNRLCFAFSFFSFFAAERGKMRVIKEAFYKQRLHPGELVHISPR